VTQQSWDRRWNDAELYKKYKLTKDEIAFIEKMIRPMDLNSNARDEALPDDDE
jgi:site-specific DNA-methyltransferase (adenine-specific)